jgi:ABC-2 type transport system permease protein
MFIVIIILLGFTTSSWVEKQNVSLQMTVAIVNEDDEAAGMKQFKQTLTSSTLSVESQRTLELQAEQLLPVKSFMQMLDGVEFVETTQLDDEAARQHLEGKEVTAIITIPAGFTQATLNKMLLSEGDGASFTLTADRHSSLGVDVLQDVIDEFMQALNLQTAIDHVWNTKAEPIGLVETNSAFGGRETIAGVEPLTSFQYYAMAIGIMASLFVSVATALKAITEKREQVFQRILLTGSHPLRYLSGKVGSTFCIALIQLSILIVLSQFIFNLFPGRSLQFWLGIGLISVMFSLCVAAIAAVFTSLIFRINDSVASGLFPLVLGVFGTIGGSFLPIYILPDWLIQVGEWTPNGLILSVIIQWIQQHSFADLSVPFLRLAVFSLMMIGLGSWLFPRRGRI